MRPNWPDSGTRPDVTSASEPRGCLRQPASKVLSSRDRAQRQASFIRRRLPPEEFSLPATIHFAAPCCGNVGVCLPLGYACDGDALRCLPIPGCDLGHSSRTNGRIGASAAWIRSAKASAVPRMANPPSAPSHRASGRIKSLLGGSAPRSRAPPLSPPVRASVPSRRRWRGSVPGARPRGPSVPRARARWCRQGW